MKILFLKGMSQYGAMRNYIDQWNFYYQKMGCETFMFDAMSGYTTEHLIALIKQLQPDLILSCNIIYGEIITSIMPEKCIYGSVLYDNPIIHGKRLAGMDNRCIVFSCDRFYAEFIRDNYKNIGKVDFLPLSGNMAKEPVPYEKRTIDLLFTGSYFDLNKQYAVIKQMNENLQIIAENMISMMIEEPDLLIWQAFDQIIEAGGGKLKDEDRLNLLNVFGCVDVFVRAYVRDQVMLHIVDGGLKVHIFGEGWEKFSCEHPENLILHKGHGDESLKALADAKLSLNVMPWFRGGIQERNIAAMLAGAVSVTDSSRYIEEHFQDKEDILLYSLKDMEEIPLIIQNVLADDEKAAYIAGNGREKALKNHTWEHRVKDMYQIILDWMSRQDM